MIFGLAKLIFNVRDCKVQALKIDAEVGEGE